MKRRIALIIILFIVLVAAGIIRFYKNLSPEIKPTDLVIESTIQKLDDDLFIIEMQVNRKADDNYSNFVYPLVSGLGNISFIEEDNLYSPSSVGDDSESHELLLNNFTFKQLNYDLNGFSIPSNKGIYKMKFTLRKFDDFQEIKDPHIYYIHKEKRFGKTLNWIEKFDVEILE
ncbi:hypothetical protein EJP82_18005 [Paenibacillus anaericanus]|uniref:Uncharacterized protein n=1 Tax=Paenibacillus anaericanus TaxID=170367 RepID=A0A433Y6D5_9BACL|nr:hypothetical protein [Paenibacillus anaericanus]RUT44508.1 hypothetical protein EJP82_18005 [Paenibacillus anaericanus]